MDAAEAEKQRVKKERQKEAGKKAVITKRQFQTAAHILLDMKHSSDPQWVSTFYPKVMFDR